MRDEKYNGWTNYATWRVQLEIVSDYVDNEYSDDFENVSTMTVEEWKENIEGYVDEVVFHDGTFNNEMSLAESYASAFLQDVDWYELAQHAKESAKEYATN